MKKPSPPIETITTTGAYGGVPSRRFPSVVGSVFTPLVGRGLSGISQRIAYRPPSAPMLESSDFHTNIPGASFLKGMKVTTFSRGKSAINDGAVDRATHLTGYLTHATLRRRLLRGK